MTTGKDGAVTVAAKVFWRTRQFWLMMILVMGSCVTIGYLIGNWVTANGTKAVLAQQERAYKEASEARQVVLGQCLTTIEKQNQRLAALGDKAATATAAAADAINKVTSEKPAQ